MNKITSLDLFVKLLKQVNCPAHTEAPMELVRYMFDSSIVFIILFMDCTVTDYWENI